MTTSATAPLSTSPADGSLATSTGQKSKLLNPLDAIKQKKANDALIAWVRNEYSTCKNARSQIERQWYLNLSFYFGKQYMAFLQNSSLPSSVNGKLVTPPAPPWRTRLVANKIRPIIRTEISRFISQKPNASVVPASSDDDDLFAAQAGEQIWESFYAQEKISASFRRAMWWMAITGTGYLKTWWDENVKDPNCLQPGKICVAPVTPFHVFVPDLTEEEIQNQPYVINAYTRPVAWVNQVFPNLNIKADTVASNEIMEDSYLNLQGSAKTKPDSVLCIEIWLKPGCHKDYPQGGVVTLVGNNVVQNITDGIPYEHGRYPFQKFDHIPTGKFYADSVIVDLIPLQREYNRTRSQIVEAKNRMSKPQLMAPKGSVDAAKITSEPGILIEYKPGLAPPAPLPLQAIPNYVLQELDRIQMDMEDISSQHEVSKGNVPTGVTAATAISYLQEKDDSVQSHTFQSIEEGFQELASQVLSLAVQYWTTEHTVKVVGTDGAFDTMVLKGTNIASGTDIRMESGSSLPTSKAARQAFIMDLMKNQFIDPTKGLELMEIGGVQKLYDELRIDERQAQRENLRMKSIDDSGMDQYDQQVNELRAQREQVAQQQAATQPPIDPTTQGQTNLPGPYPDNVGPTVDSQQAPPQQIDPTNNSPFQDAQTGQAIDPPLPVPVNNWDNHQTHIMVHNNFRKGQSFELLSDAAKRLFELHVQMHQAQMMQQAPPPGLMGGPGGPDLSSMLGGGGSPGPQPGGGGNQFTTQLGGAPSA